MAEDPSGRKARIINDQQAEAVVKVPEKADALRLQETSVAFLTLAETAGMGMKADQPEFKSQFSGMEIGDQMVAYTKLGKSAANEVDAISGSTVTTSAVVKATNAALTAVSYLEGGAQ